MFDELLLCDDERDEPERDLEDEERFLPLPFLLPELPDVSSNTTINTAPIISSIVVIAPLSSLDSSSLSAFEELSEEGFFLVVVACSPSACDSFPPTFSF